MVFFEFGGFGKNEAGMGIIPKILIRVIPMEQYLKDAIGLYSPQVTPEPLPILEVEPQPQVTIYDFADLLSKNEPPKFKGYHTETLIIKIQLL
ncbi:hypothetical protein [Nostoc sp. NIES-3756]|uniref:hypothetical protein n=1 Tax=Nostoc sp. NIES-3756 TaxID=1751286 RepID=UPI00082C62E6|nr:hypothetical protein [Nostoc sp. NIES-3756]